jgi:hypothetical protein
MEYGRYGCRRVDWRILTMSNNNNKDPHKGSKMMLGRLNNNLLSQRDHLHNRYKSNRLCLKLELLLVVRSMNLLRFLVRLLINLYRFHYNLKIRLEQYN